MSFVISFINQKGGVGKSNLSVNVAACFGALLSQKVLLIDADKQGTASDWASLRSETSFQVVKMARENMARDALSLAANFDFTVIDGPPQAIRISPRVHGLSDGVDGADRFTLYQNGACSQR